jgi:hypothetical protein
MTTTPTSPELPRRTRCTGQPVSWLVLERYHASQLEAPERAAIEQHLAACPACSACLTRIREDDSVALAPLPVSPPGRVARPVLVGGAVESRPGRLSWLRSPPAMALASTLAIAAAVVLGIGRDWWRPAAPGTDGTEATAVRVKGGSVAFTLVRDDDERIEGAEGVFRDGDRFKVLVTCPPSLNAAFDVVVFEAGAAASFPLKAAPAFACGNQVPLAGAMRLTGAKPETVCVAWDETGEVDRALAAALPEGGGGTRDRARSLCKHLAPAR